MSLSVELQWTRSQLWLIYDPPPSEHTAQDLQMTSAINGLERRKSAGILLLICPMVWLAVHYAQVPDVRPQPQPVTVEQQIAGLYVYPKPRSARDYMLRRQWAAFVRRKPKFSRNLPSRVACIKDQLWQLNYPAHGRPVPSDHPHRPFLDPSIEELVEEYPFTTLNRLVRLDSPELLGLLPGYSVYRLAWTRHYAQALMQGHCTLLVDQQNKTQRFDDTGWQPRDIAFGRLLKQHKVQVRCLADAKTVLAAYCDFHDQHFRANKCEQIDTHTWHLKVHRGRIATSVLELKLGSDQQVLAIEWIRTPFP